MGLGADRKLPLRKMDDPTGWPFSSKVSLFGPLFYLYNKRPSPSFPVAFRFIGTNRSRHFHWLDSIPLNTRVCPSLTSQALAQMSFYFVIASVLSVGKMQSDRRTPCQHRKMLQYLSQFPNGIWKKLICGMTAEFNPYVAHWLNWP